MFDRIARRHADRSEEQAASDAAEAPPAGAPSPAAAPAGDASASGDAAAPPPADAPTERIEAVAPAPAVDEPTVFQPAAVPPLQQPSVPPPTLDLTARIAMPPAAPPPAPQQPPAAIDAPAPVAAEQPAPAAPQPAEPAPRRPGFRARGRMRRRLRYLRRLRDLQVRDLGGLVFDLRRFERKREDLVAQKIDQIRACDDELRALERALDERRDLRDVREPGIGGNCPRCFAVYGSADKFCANCGAALGGGVQGPHLAAPPPAPPAQPQAGGSEPGR